MITAPFPELRLRRLRRSANLRELITEHRLTTADLIYPMFLLPGKNTRQAITSMPGIERLSLDLLLEEIKTLHVLGILAIALFPVLPDEAKTEQAEEAYNDQGLIPEAVRTIKQAYPEMIVITDIALDPYTSHGQDGLLDAEGQILNDATVAVLVKQALCHARAGADIVAPSDMMDGRIGALRQALEKQGYSQTAILSYAVKYASYFYGPFREAVGSLTRLGKADKKTYQLNFANAEEGLREAAQDIAEGADILMVKPGLPYLDMAYRLKTTFQMPTFAYQVSGEYAMLKLAAKEGWLNEKEAVLETLLAFKRAGCDAIFTYYAKEVAQWLARPQAL